MRDDRSTPSPRDEKQGLSWSCAESVTIRPHWAAAEIDEVQRRLAEALARTPLPAEPDRVAVDRFLVDAYRRAWGW